MFRKLDQEVVKKLEGFSPDAQLLFFQAIGREKAIELLTEKSKKKSFSKKKKAL